MISNSRALSTTSPFGVEAIGAESLLDVND